MSSTASTLPEPRAILRRRTWLEGLSRPEQRLPAEREAIREQMLDKALDLLARIDEPHIDYRGKDIVEVRWEKAPSGDVQRYVTSVGILIDKYRLEMGETTGRTESIGLSPIDLEFQKVLDEFNRQHG